MRIIVLEDNIHHQLRLESALYDVAKNLNLHIYVKCATTLEEFEDYKQKEAVNQVYFLDLEIDGDRDKGFQIAKTIRETNPYAVIIFTTTLSEAMPLVFKNHVSALDFITKDLPEKDYRARVKQCLEQVLKHGQTNKHEEILHYSYQGRPGINIPISDILFIQTSVKSHRLVIYTSEFIKEFYGSLSEILQLDTKNHFQRVDRSAIVNVQNIASYDSKTKEVMFFEGTTCPVSRLHLKTLKIRMKELGIL